MSAANGFSQDLYKTGWINYHMYDNEDRRFWGFNPMGKVDSGDTLTLNYVCVTSDEVEYEGTQEITLGDLPVPPTLPNPQLTVTETDYGTVRFSVPDEDYFTIGARVYWTDGDGNEYEVLLDNFVLEDGV